MTFTQYYKSNKFGPQNCNIYGVWHYDQMEYSNKYSLPGLWTDFLLKLKYALLLLIRPEFEIAIQSRRNI